MIITCIQNHPRYLETSINLEHVKALLRGVDADLVVLPELFASGYFFQSISDVERVAEPVPGGPTVRRLERWARETGATFVAGLPERAANGARYNSAVVVTPRGWLGTYRKVHLYYEEKRHFAPGDLGFPVFDVEDRAGKPYRLGVMVCFDWYFPESARSLALAGADVVAHPANLVRPDCPRAMPIRALENHVFTATANRIGEETNGAETLRFIGRSLICDPRGQMLATAGPDEEAVIGVEIEPSEAANRQLTRHNHLFGDRRPEHYGKLLG
jgi:predicted amidohydrolase